MKSKNKALTRQGQRELRLPPKHTELDEQIGTGDACGSQGSGYPPVRVSKPTSYSRIWSSHETHFKQKHEHHSHTNEKKNTQTQITQNTTSHSHRNTHTETRQHEQKYRQSSEEKTHITQNTTASQSHKYTHTDTRHHKKKRTTPQKKTQKRQCTKRQ